MTRPEADAIRTTGTGPVAVKSLTTSLTSSLNILRWLSLSIRSQFVNLHILSWSDDVYNNVLYTITDLWAALHQVVLLEVGLQDGVLHRREHEADVLRVWSGNKTHHINYNNQLGQTIQL